LATPPYHPHIQHADIGTTERYYGHLERHVLAAGAVATEEAIARAAVTPRLLRSA
jgi:hypothetical protein